MAVDVVARIKEYKIMDANGGTFLDSYASALPPEQVFPPQSEVFALPIASFWRRVIADCIDLVLLGLGLLIVATIFFRSYFYSIGPYGRLYSFIIGTTYFTYFSSNLSNGQTFGKRVLNIVVTDARGELLPVKKAFFRSVALFVIWLFNSWDLPVFFSIPVIGILITIIVFGGILSLLYGYIFNRTTRQGPHDMLVDSYVIRVANPAFTYRALPRPRLHTKMIVTLFVVGGLLGIAGFLIKPMIRDSSVFELYDALNKDNDRFHQVGVTVLHSITSDQDRLILNVWMPKKCSHQECDQIAADLLNTVADKYDKIDKIDSVDIEFYNAIDLGLSHFTTGFYSRSWSVNGDFPNDN